mgnify:CR=1 FL=1
MNFLKFVSALVELWAYMHKVPTQHVLGTPLRGQKMSYPPKGPPHEIPHILACTRDPPKNYDFPQKKKLRAARAKKCKSAKKYKKSPHFCK